MLPLQMQALVGAEYEVRQHTKCVDRIIRPTHRCKRRAGARFRRAPALRLPGNKYKKPGAIAPGFLYLLQYFF